jgi:hypothetical protein
MLGGRNDGSSAPGFSGGQGDSDTGAVATHEEMPSAEVSDEDIPF